MLSLACDDRPGLVAAIASFLAGHGGNITDAEQYNDASTARFFMRVAFDPGPTAPETYRDLFAPLAKEHGMDWRLRHMPGKRTSRNRLSPFSRTGFNEENSLTLTTHPCSDFILREDYLHYS